MKREKTHLHVGVRPKKPSAPFFLFVQDRYKTLSEAERGSGLGTAAKFLSKIWHELPEEERDLYRKHHRKNCAEYRVALAEWEKDQLVFHEFGSAKRKITTPKPPRPPTPYFMFMKENYQTVKKQNPNLKTSKELVKVLATLWKNLPLVLKKRYQETYKEQQLQYKRKEKCWKKHRWGTLEEDHEGDESPFEEDENEIHLFGDEEDEEDESPLEDEAEDPNPFVVESSQETISEDDELEE